jgi:hypothetical protein
LNLGATCLADGTAPRVFPPLQIFKEICVDGSWDLNDVLKLAEKRHFVVVSSEDLPIPNLIAAHKIVWSAASEVGPIAVVVVAGENKAHIYRLTCSVSAPLQYSSIMQSWVTSSAGEPISNMTKPNKAVEIRWAKAFPDMKIDFELDTLAPDDQHLMLSITKQIDMKDAKRK